MDTSLSSRPVRRHAHVCRVCNSAFMCKAELLEHEQEAHTAGSGSHSSLSSSKRRSATALSDVSDSTGASPLKLYAVAKKTSVNMSQPVSVTAVAVDLPVDHEEVYESHMKMKATHTVMQNTRADSAVSMQQKSVSSGGSSVAKHADSVCESRRKMQSTDTVMKNSQADSAVSMQQKSVSSSSSSVAKHANSVSESRRKMQSTDTVMKNSQADSAVIAKTAVSVQQKSVSSGGSSVAKHADSVCESRRKMQSTDSVMKNSQADSAVSVQQKAVSSGGSSVAKHTDSVLPENRQTSCFLAAARSDDQVGGRVAEVTSGFAPTTSMLSQSSLSHQISQTSTTAEQIRGPLIVASGSTAGTATEANKSPEGDVIKALGLKRKEGMTDVTTTSSDNPDVDEDDTKPPASDSSTDITTLDGRDLTRYEVVGSINEEPHGHVSDSGVTERKSRDAAVQTVASFPALTKEEAANCVAGLYQGDCYTESVNNDELQLLAAVSSTRSRDVVVIKPESPSPMPASQPQQQQQVTDVMGYPTDIIEQEVELETTEFDSDSGRLSGRQMKKCTSASASPVCIVKLPMTSPRQFTSTDGAQKRMVAVTVARPPRMVSVLLRNRGNASTEEQEQQQVPETNKTAETDGEQPTLETTDDKTTTDIVASTNVVVEPVAAADLSDEAATAAQTITLSNEAGDNTENNTASEVQEVKIEVCIYCEQSLPPDEMAQHVSLSHVCDQCGRKFRQPANLRKVKRKTNILLTY